MDSRGIKPYRRHLHQLADSLRHIGFPVGAQPQLVDLDGFDVRLDFGGSSLLLYLSL